jgi:hypothetical protein
MRTLLSATIAASLLFSPVAEANGFAGGHGGWHGGGGGGWHDGGGWHGGYGYHPGYRWGWYGGHWSWWPFALFGLAVGAAVAAPYYYAPPYPYYYAPAPRQCWSGYSWYPC